MALNGKDFATSIIINGIIFLICVVVFSYLRVHKYSARFYSPKRFNNEVLKKPKRLPLGLFQWAFPIFSYPEEEVMEVAGLDTVVFIRLLKLGRQMFFWITLWVVIVLVPTNYTGTVVDSDPSLRLSDLDRVSLSNLAPGDSRMWVHLITVYVISYIVLRLLWEANQGVSQLRVKFMSMAPKGGATHTVLVTDVPGLKHGTVLDTVVNGVLYRWLPKSLQHKLDDLVDKTFGGLSRTISALPIKKSSSKEAVDVERCDESAHLVLDPWDEAREKLSSGMRVQEVVEQEMDAVYGGPNVHSVHVVHDQAALAPLVAKYDAVRAQLEDLVDNYLSLKKRGKEVERKEVRVIGAMHGKWGMDKYGAVPVKVDALQHYCDLLTHLKEQIDQQVQEAQGSDLPAAFATFNNRYTQAVASTALQSHDETCWRVQAAPGAEEVVWENLGMRFWQRNMRELLMWGVLVVVIMFFMPVTLALQSIIQLEKLDQTPVIKDIAALPVVREVIKAILPGLVLKIFLAVLPLILSVMMHKAGRISLSTIDEGVVSKFFVFQFFAVFVFTFLGGAVLNQIDTIVSKVNAIANNPIAEMTTILGVAAPQQATFFMTYVLLSIGAKSINFIRVVGLALFWVFSKLAATQRAKRRLWADQPMVFGKYTADHVMVILFGLVFCCIMPLIAPVCLVYFTVVSVLEKYNMIYVFTHKYEAGGRMWGALFSQVMVAVYFLQLMMLFLLGIKHFAFAVLLLPLPILTGIFHWSCNTLFERPWQLQVLRAAADLDRLDAQAKAGRSKAADSLRAMSPAEDVPWADGDKHTVEEKQVDVGKLYLSPCFKVSDEELAELLAEAARCGRMLEGKEEGEEGGVTQLHAGSDSDDREPETPHAP